MKDRTAKITGIILEAARKAREETKGEPEPHLINPAEWPIQCTVGPGLEGAIACESRIGYVNGSKGWLIYRGYDIFDLCAHTTYEEVSYLLLNGKLPNREELDDYRDRLFKYSHLPLTMRTLMGFPVEKMNTMGALRLGTNMMRQEFTNLDTADITLPDQASIGSDEDSIAMETTPRGQDRATYEFRRKALGKLARARRKPRNVRDMEHASGIDASLHLIAGVPAIMAAIARIHRKRMPLEPRRDLSHAGNLLYMITGQRPDPEEERIMDICLILHADHGMNASTFATMVVASTLADMYFSIGAGIGALSGPLHGGANEEVVRMLKEIGSPKKVKSWLAKKRAEGKKITGFGHRVYKSYDPRARILGPLAEYMVGTRKKYLPLYETAKELEQQVVRTLGSEKKIFPNVDFYSGIVYSCLDIPTDFFTPIFAVSRVAGWTARTMEYLENNRIFRPRALYTGDFNRKVDPIDRRG